MQGENDWPLAEKWAGTYLPIAGHFRNAITAEVVEGTDRLDVAQLLRDFPVAVMVQDSSLHTRHGPTRPHP